MEENNKSNFASRFLIYYFAAVFIILGIIIARPFLKNKLQNAPKEPEAQADASIEEDVAVPQDSQETVGEPEPGIDITYPEIKLKETSELNLKDYFVLSRLVEGNEAQYRLSSNSGSIDQLVDDYHYFDFCRFVAEYLGNNTKIFYDRFIGDGSIHLTAEQSPLGNPTTVFQDDLGWILRIVIDKENAVSTLEDCRDYVDLRTQMKNNGSFYTDVIVCRGGTYYASSYVGKMRPNDMVFNMPGGTDESSFLFIIEKDALKSLLKMAEQGVLLSDENPFEAIGDEWKELESYSLFVNEDDTEG